MQPKYRLSVEGIDFVIHKKIDNNTIIKRIEFSDKGRNYFFEEKVSLLTKTDFETMASTAGFKLQEVFGDYKLNPFDEKNSDRLILIFKK